MTTPDTPSPANILYPSASKPDTPSATPGTTTKAAAASPATSPPSGAPKPAATSPATAAPAAPAAPGTSAPPDPAAVLFNAPLAASELADVMKLPDDLDAAGFADTPEAKAERQAFRDALAGEGVNRQEAEFIAQFTIASAAPSYVAPDYDAAHAELLSEWKDQYAANLDYARKAVQRIAAKVPGVKRHLRDTGADNDPKLIRALARMGRKRGL
jgi:hypothetical protein